MRIAEVQADCAGVQCHRVGANRAAGVAADARSGGGKHTVVGLGCCADAGRDRQRRGVEGGCDCADGRRCEAVVAGIARHLVARARACASTLGRAGEVQRRAACGRHVAAARMGTVKRQAHTVEAAAVGANKAGDAATREAAAGSCDGAVVGLGGGGDRRGRDRQRRGVDGGCLRTLDGEAVVVVVQRKAAKGDRRAGIGARHVRAVVGGRRGAGNAYGVAAVRLAVARSARAGGFSCLQGPGIGQHRRRGAVIDLARGH